MNDIPNTRRSVILEWLQERGTLTIDELAARLNVSAMTVHRDLDALERGGMARKVHGGVTLAESRPAAGSTPTCLLCQMTVPERTTFIIQTENGDPIQTCCPHCGFLLLSEREGVVSALARDFLYGRMVNATQAFFLAECELTMCCLPTVLCFANTEDALRFQRGFGGQVLTFTEALNFVTRQHRGISLHE